MLVSKALADRRAGIHKLPLLTCKDQRPRFMLQMVILFPPVKNVLIMMNRDDFSIGEFFKDLCGTAQNPDSVLNVDMGERLHQTVPRPIRVLHV